MSVNNLFGVALIEFRATLLTLRRSSIEMSSRYFSINLIYVCTKLITKEKQYTTFSNTSCDCFRSKYRRSECEQHQELKAF